MKDAFPANYFASWTSPVKMFTNRKSMKWWQLILVFVFLFALVLTPVPLYYQQKTTVDIGEYMPEVSQMLNDKELQQIAKTASYSKDEYSFKNSQVLKNEKGRLMGINLPKKQVDKAKSAVVMCDKFFYLRDRKVTYKIFYNEKYAPNEGKLKDQLVKTWYLRNKAAIAFSMMFLVGSMFLMTDVLIILVGSIFLWLARKSPMDRKLQRSGQRHVKRFGAGIVGGICFRDSAFRLVIDDGRAIGCRNHFDACRIYKNSLQ